MIRRLREILKAFLILRTGELIFAVIILVLITFLWPIENIENFGEENIDITINEILVATKVYAVFGIIYVIFSYYILLSIAVFLICEFTFRISRKNIAYLNSLPYVFHELFALFGYFGGKPSLDGFIGMAWILMIIAFNFFAPKWLIRLGWIDLDRE